MSEVRNVPSLPPTRTPAVLRNDGGVVLRVVICVMTLFILAGFIVFVLRSFELRKVESDRKALAISEYGLQFAFEKIMQSPSWSQGVTQEPYDGGHFSVAVERTSRGDTVFVLVKSTGTAGSVVKTRESLLRLEVSGEDSTWVRERMQ